MTLKHIISPEKRRAKLKEVLQSKRIIRGIEVHNAISALIANDLKVEKKDSDKINEFDFFWESSLTDSASKGHPDIEIISFDSRLKTITEILEVTDKPIIVDGDTGGDIHHFEYLIPKLERMGVSAIIIEDKIFPKRNSLESGTNQAQEEPDKFAQKIRLGKQIQSSEDFMIIARIESLIAGKNVDDAIFRARKYLEAGADGIMIHSKSESPQEIFEFAKRYESLCKEMNLKRPLVAVPTTYNSIYESELTEQGFSVVIYANHFLRASYKAMENIGKIILQNERSFEAEPMISSVRELFEKVGFLDIKEKDLLLDETPSVIIPAAGETDFNIRQIVGELPKALIKINGKTILEHQINLFKKFGLNDINVIIGYKREKFNISGINYIENLEYSHKGMLHSLMKAKNKMQKGFIYINGDLLIDERLIREIINRKEDIVLVVDNSYLYHKHEVDKKLDAVITKHGNSIIYQKLRNTDDEIIKIGKNIPRDSMTHEFIGMAKFSKRGAEILKKVYEKINFSHLGKFHEAEDWNSASGEDIIQELIDQGVKIISHETNGGWIEIHNNKDIQIADQFLRTHSI